MIDSQEIRDWVIYKITSPTDRIYIGKTSNWYNRYSNYKNFTVAKQVHKQRILYSSLLKYGFEAHKIEVIERFQSNINYCSGKEMFWIRSYMSNICKYPEMKGMNLTDGGEGNLGWKRPEESRKAIAEKNRGKKRTDEQRKKIALGKIGNKNSCGRKLTDRHKNILSESAKRKKGDENFKKICKDRAIRMNREIGKDLVQLDENNNIIRRFDFVCEAANLLGISEHSVMAKLNGRKLRNDKYSNLFLKYTKNL